MLVFLSPQKATAGEAGIVINEVMSNPNVGGIEWIELFNSTASNLILIDYTIEDGTGTTKNLSSCGIATNSYLVLEKGSGACKFSFGLNNDGDIIILKKSGLEIDKVTYGGLDINAPIPAQGESIARNPNGYDTDAGSDFVNEKNPTPGTKNNDIILPPPTIYPEEVLNLVNLDNAIIRHVQVSRIIDGDTIEVTPGLEFGGVIYPKVRLLFIDTPETGEPFYDSAKDFTSELLEQSLDLLISKNSDEQLSYDRVLAVVIYGDKIFNTELLEQGLANYYDYKNSVIIEESWLSILQQAQREEVGLWETAANIILSELLPDPVGLDSEGEWVEIYNPNDEIVILKRYLLDKYLIPEGTSIGPKNFLVFRTGVALNNNGDTVKFSFPGGLLIDETSYGQADEGISWANIDGVWNWTSNLTPGEINVYNSPILVEAGGNTLENIDIPINSSPIEIHTGEFRNFENYLVTITGTVVETSGNTFYLDDGSGKAKVYIQDATGIDKPPMHKGDIFEVTGIVNLYRDTWRILPQKQEDVKLIQAAEGSTSGSSVIKKASAKSTSAKNPTTSTTARSPTSSKQVAGTTAENTEVQVAGVKSPWWIQMIKAITGLAAVLLIIFAIQLRRWRRENPQPSDFGDET